MKLSIRTLYLYLFSFLGLLITVIGTIRLVNVGIKTFIFPDADTYVYVSTPTFDAEGKLVQESEEQKKAREENDRLNTIRQRQRELTEAFSFILVGIPLYVYHWRTIQKDYEQERRHNG